MPELDTAADKELQRAKKNEVASAENASKMQICSAVIANGTESGDEREMQT